MLDMRKILLSCVCSVALLASFAGAGTDGITNGGFDGSATGWTWLPLSGAQGSATAGYDGTNGNPPGSALLQNLGGAVATNNHRYYEVFPVTPGNTYYLRGQWKGDIRGVYVNNPADPCARNWAEVIIVFSAAPLTASDAAWTASTAIKYKKRFFAGGGMNTLTGIWDWESVLTSPGDGAGPADGAFVAPAGMNYMTVSFNVGGRANSVVVGAAVGQPGSVWFLIDNFHVCDAASAGDLNVDCSVNFKDLAYIGNQWLTCGLDPATACW